MRRARSGSTYACTPHPPQFLFIVVIVLFGVMNMGAVVGFYEDAHERRNVMARLLAPELGFEEPEEGVWTWAFAQNRLTRAVEAPSGSAVQIAGIMGFPFIRCAHDAHGSLSAQQQRFGPSRLHRRQLSSAVLVRAND
jgi:hypothetical protein